MEVYKMVTGSPHLYGKYSMEIDLSNPFVKRQHVTAVLHLHGLGMNHYGIIYVPFALYQALRAKHFYKIPVSEFESSLLINLYINLEEILLDLELKQKIPFTDHSLWKYTMHF